MAITHKKVSTVIDGIDTSLIRPSDWNESHELKESGGTALTFGAIADTRILKRSGTTIIGATVDSANTASAIVQRDGSGNFAAGTITASLTGNASGSSGTCTGAAASNVLKAGDTMSSTLVIDPATDVTSALKIIPASNTATTKFTIQARNMADGADVFTVDNAGNIVTVGNVDGVDVSTVPGLVTTHAALSGTSAHSAASANTIT